MTDEKQLSRNREQIVAELDALYEKATPGTWLLYTSNSWRRIGTKFDYREIIYPMRHRSDGHPDLGGPNIDHDLAFLLALKEAWPEIRTLLASSESAMPDFEQRVRNAAESAGVDWMGDDPGGNMLDEIKAQRERLGAVVKWLEANQPDVFQRGLWDAVREAVRSSGERGQSK